MERKVCGGGERGDGERGVWRWERGGDVPPNTSTSSASDLETAFIASSVRVSRWERGVWRWRERCVEVGREEMEREEVCGDGERGGVWRWRERRCLEMGREEMEREEVCGDGREVGRENVCGDEERGERCVEMVCGREEVC